MFKNMSLSKKMALGFGTLIVIAGVLGGMTWNGLNQISQTASLGRKGNQCVGTLDKCASLRRDFALRGFAKADGETKNAAEKWRDAHAELGSQLTTLAAEPGLEESKRALARSAAEKTEAYRGSFDKQADARANRDKGSEGWSQVGKSVTTDVENALDTVIMPALAAAQQSQNIEGLTKWAEISDKLDKDVIQPFLLLRVCAVYFLATNQEEQWTAYENQLKKVKDGLTAWTPLVRGEAQLEAMVNNFQGYFQRYEAAGAQYHAGVLAERAADTEMGKVAGDIVAIMNQLGAGLEGAAAMEAITSQTNRLTMGMALGAIIFGTLLAVVITRSVVRPINRIISGLNDGSDQVNDAAAQVAMASQELAEGASEQASSLEETSSALEEVAAMTRNNAENAKQAHELSEQAKAAAQEGDRTMNQLNSAMTGINDSSSQISKIIKVIEEIAFQTNLLALNAAVEAARAGEHGKGFAVVADEVRNLAQRAAQASREVTGLIEDSVGRAREGTTVAADVGKVLGTIVGDVTKVATLIDGITKASDEQAQGVEQVNVAVSQMDRVTQQNAAGAEESASAAEELSAQATAVKGIVDELAVVIRGAGAQSKSTPSRMTAASGKKQRSFGGNGLQTNKKTPRSASPAEVMTSAPSNAAPPANGSDLSQF